MKVDVKTLIKSIALPLLVGGAAAFVTRDSMESFEVLNQPPLSPPGWLFPVVWTILYILMGISAYLISEESNKDTKKESTLYYYQLIVNFLWPIFFFNFGWYLFSFFWLLLLWTMVFVMIKSFASISKLAAYLNIPYLIWLTFAAYLNLGVWLLNR